jgi:hypothetical protein
MSRYLADPIGRALLIAPPDWRRTWRFVATAWLLALGAIWTAQQLHRGSHEELELTPMVHLLRDTSLAVPLAALAMAIGGLLAVEVALVLRFDPARPTGRVCWAILAALVFAALSIPGEEAHGLLFGAEPETGDWLIDVGRDAGAVLLASLAVLVPASLARLAPWPPDPEASATDPFDAARLMAGRRASVPVRRQQGVSRDA